MTKVVSAVCTLLACGVVAVGNAEGGPVALYESIESTGAQFVRLDDIMSSPTLQAVLDFVPLEHTGYINIGTNGKDDDTPDWNRAWRFFSYSGGVIFDAGSSRIGEDPSKVLPLGTRQIVRFGIEEGVMYLNVKDAATGVTTIELSGNLNCTFAAAPIYVFYPGTKMRVYSLKLYDFRNPGDTSRSLIADLVPCAGGVYDLVTGKAYLSTSGADAFVMGPRKSIVDLETTSAYDPETKQLTVSALLKEADNPQDLLLVLTGADGVATTNVIRKAATASETPYELVLNDLPENATLLPRFVSVDTQSGLPVTKLFDAFYTGEVLIVAGADADVANGSDGYFTVSRGDSAAATAWDLAVNYTVGGTAVGGTDYVALFGTVTIPAGASSARISVVQLANPEADGDRTLSLGLAEGLYAIDAEASAAQIAVKPLTLCWRYDPVTGLMTDGCWTFNATGEPDAIVVGEIISSDPAETVLDFSKSVAGGGKIVSVGEGACCKVVNGAAIAASQQMTELVIGTTITNIGLSAFRNIRDLRTVTLPTTPLFIGDAAFMDNRNLTTVTPFLPEATEIDATVFYNCTRLTGDLVLCNKSQKKLVTNRSNREYGVFRYTAITSVDMGDSVLEDIAFSCFRDCGQLKSVILPATLKSIGMDPAPEAGASFYNCGNLQTITFQSFPEEHFPQDTFGPNNAYWGRRILYPVGDPKWVAFVNNGTFVNWENAGIYQSYYTYTDLPAAGYMTLFPNTANGVVTLWVVPYENGEVGTVSLQVTSDPIGIGVADPAYGLYEDIGAQLPTNCTASAAGQDNLHYYECVGSRVGKSEAGAIFYGELRPGHSAPFDADEGGTYALRWDYVPVGHKLACDVVSGFSVSVAGDAVVEGYYRTNTIVRLTVEDSTLECWTGDVPAGHERDNPLDLVMDAPKTVKPVLSTPWVYDGTTLTDGYWTFNASGEPDAIVVGEIISSDPAVTTLDFSKSVAGGGKIVSVGDGACCKVVDGTAIAAAKWITNLIVGDSVTNIGISAFRNMANLKSVRLPEGLKLIGNAAFMDNRNLTTVTPFLPPDTVIEPSVFYTSGRSALTGALVLSSPRQTELKANPIADIAYFGIFYDARISSADLTKTRIARIGQSVFQGATLGDLFFPKTLKQVDQHAFSDCGHLTNIVFRSFPTTLDWNAVFGHSVSERIVPAFRRRIAYPAGNADWAAQIVAWSRSGDLTPWDGLDAETQAQYRANYGQRSTPVGRLGEGVLGTDNAAWLVPMNFGVGTMVLVQ